jgi:glycerol-3-phosphate acyltransferase PlsY
MDWLVAALAGYALGSIPFGLLLARAAGKGDIRQVGSGNIGATNVLRTGSKGLAAAVLLLDLAKGFLAVWMAARFIPGAEGVVALATVLGHCFPVWLAFKGGKGVATTAGVCFALAWPIGLAYAVLWLGMLALVRISSLAAIGRWDLLPVLAAIALLVLVLHRANIARLRAGTEPRVGRSR